MSRHVLCAVFRAPVRSYYVFWFCVFLVLAIFAMNVVSFPAMLRGEVLVSETLHAGSILFVVLFAFLAALVMALHQYRARFLYSSHRSSQYAGIAGGMFGVTTSACSICYPFILSLLGVPLAFAALPFGGIELYAASIGLLLVSIYLALRGTENSSCALPEAAPLAG